MNDEITDISMKVFTGGKLTEDETKRLREYDVKYALVKFVYLEKRNHGSSMNLKQFHFTPGDKFMETPIFDIVQELLKFDIFAAKARSRPPVTGVDKSEL